jgi:hypothetical protein
MKRLTARQRGVRETETESNRMDDRHAPQYAIFSIIRGIAEGQCCYLNLHRKHPAFSVVRRLRTTPDKALSSSENEVVNATAKSCNGGRRNPALNV